MWLTEGGKGTNGPRLEWGRADCPRGEVSQRGLPNRVNPPEVSRTSSVRSRAGANLSAVFEGGNAPKEAASAQHSGGEEESQIQGGDGEIGSPPAQGLAKPPPPDLTSLTQQKSCELRGGGPKSVRPEGKTLD